LVEVNAIRNFLSVLEGTTSRSGVVGGSASHMTSLKCKTQIASMAVKLAMQTNFAECQKRAFDGILNRDLRRHGCKWKSNHGISIHILACFVRVSEMLIFLICSKVLYIDVITDQSSCVSVAFWV